MPVTSCHWSCDDSCSTYASQKISECLEVVVSFVFTAGLVASTLIFFLLLRVDNRIKADTASETMTTPSQ
ncbi:hypothetical protein FZX13_00315 [Synechococcus sp. MU1625]|nr:hypothetical protein [Synechococcus sp. MU1625]